MNGKPIYDIHHYIAKWNAPGSSVFSAVFEWADHVQRWALDGTEAELQVLLEPEIAAHDALHMSVYSPNGFGDLLSFPTGITYFFSGHRALQKIAYQPCLDITSRVYALLRSLNIPEEPEPNTFEHTLSSLPATLGWRQRLYNEVKHFALDHPDDSVLPYVGIEVPDDDGHYDVRRVNRLTESLHATWRDEENNLTGAIAAYLEANASLLECRRT